MGIIYPTSLAAVIDTNAIISSDLPVGYPTVIAAGDVLYVPSGNPEVQLADQDVIGATEVVGVALETPTTTSIKTVTRFGSIVNTKFASAPTSSAQIGDLVYLSSTAGQATMVVPTTGSVYKLGVLLSEVDQGGGKYKILFMPVKVADLL